MQSPRVWDVCCEGVEGEEKLATMRTFAWEKFKEIPSRWILLLCGGCWVGGQDDGGGGALGGGVGVTFLLCFVYLLSCCGLRIIFLFPLM